MPDQWETPWTWAFNQWASLSNCVWQMRVALNGTYSTTNRNFFIYIFLASGGGSPSPQDHYGRCRIRTRDLCPKKLKNWRATNELPHPRNRNLVFLFWTTNESALNLSFYNRNIFEFLGDQWVPVNWDLTGNVDLLSLTNERDSTKFSIDHFPFCVTSESVWTDTSTNDSYYR